MKHRDLAEAISKDYFVVGWDRDDVRQEAMIALWEASENYDASHGVPFRSFARIVIHRRMVDCIKQSKTKKHSILSDAVREWDEWVGREDERVEMRERLTVMIENSKFLTPLERTALDAYIAGVPAKVSKSHDNALTRARNKLLHGNGRKPR